MDRKSCLFYPCAGSDIQPAISFFNTKVDSFWFVDSRTYRHRSPRIDREWHPKQVEELAVGNAKVKRFQLRDTARRREVEVNFVDGDGESVFASLFGTNAEIELTVFFYRGDSCGEGGSGVCWLSDVECECGTPGLLRRVLELLHKPGLIVTDGSNSHALFRKYFDSREPIVDAHLHSEPFQLGKYFLSPTDTLGTRYGPTIVWEVTEG